MRTNIKSIFLTIFFSISFSQICLTQPPANWTKKYNEGNNMSDRAIALDIDNNCNVFVTGSSDSLGTGSNYVTIKYDENGDQIWTAIYDGPDHLDDMPTAIKTDANGNVYVTGKSASLNHNFDFLTIKYNSNGVKQWASRFNSANNLEDIANDLAVDPNGNVYVCGNQGTGSALVKYNQSGNQVWAETDEEMGDWYNQYNKIKISSTGAIEVMGTYGSSGVISEMSEVRLYHFDASGYEGMSYWLLDMGIINPKPIDFLLKSSGEAIICAYAVESGNENIYLLSTANMFGSFASFIGAGTANSRPTAIKSDNSNNIYISGYTDSYSNSTINYNYLTVKYNSNGVQQWYKTYGNNYEDKAIDMALGSGSSPDIFTCGYTTDPAGDIDITTIKYNNNGVFQTSWTQVYLSNDADIPVGIKIDAYNNVLLTGTTGGLNTENFITAKYCNNAFNPTISWLSLNTLTASTGVAYQWYFNNSPINGAVQKTLNITATGDGNYFCMVSQYCCSYASNVMSAYVGLQDMKSKESALVYPNPNDGNFTISYDLPENHKGYLEIFCTSGACIYAMPLPPLSISQKITLPNISDGLYYCIITSDNFRSTRKMIVSQKQR